MDYNTYEAIGLALTSGTILGLVILFFSWLKP